MLLKLFRYFIIFYLGFPILSFAQNSPDFYISNQGKDYNAGTSIFSPRRTITATSPLIRGLAASKGSVKVALESGSIFPESLVTSYPIEITTYADQSGSTDFAILDGGKEFSNGWIKKDSTNFTFEQGIPYSGFSGSNINGLESYSFIYVTEIDKSLEKIAPITARKLLIFDTSLADVEKIPGSFYSPVNTIENPKLMYIHTSDGSSPNVNEKYRYEVTVRAYGVNSSFQENNVFENLWVRGGGAGYGMLPGGANSSYNKIIFGPGAGGIHHLVVRSGIINHSLFLPAAKNTNDFAVVFYDVQGLGRHCAIKNSIFLDIGAPVYSHISNGANYALLEMANIVGFGDTTKPGALIASSNTDTVLLSNVFAQDYSFGYDNGNAKYSTISNCYFKDVYSGIIYNTNTCKSFLDNVFVKTNGLSYANGIELKANTSLQLTHSILHIYTSANENGGTFIQGNGSPNSKIVATGNIFISDLNPLTTLTAATTNTDNGVATSADKWDYNVYILLRGDKITWKVTNSATNRGSAMVDDFEQWKSQSGQDEHSLFFDLRNDPRGLQAIFIDPVNGNYELANTPEGKQIATLGAGMSSPLTCFLKKPSYEAAADLIKNNGVLSINTCRNPCEQNTLRINNSLAVKIIGNNKISILWNISEQQNINHYELQRATANSVFKRIGIIPVGADSSYTFNDDVQIGVPYQYRLLVVAQAGNACYSDAKSVKIIDKPNSFTIYPNPSNGKFWLSLNGYLGKGNYSILNVSGQPLFSKEFFSIYNPEMLDFTQQPKGIYFVKMQTSEGICIQKFVIE